MYMKRNRKRLSDTHDSEPDVNLLNSDVQSESEPITEAEGETYIRMILEK
jgi:hypothetical protein